MSTNDAQLHRQLKRLATEQPQLRKHLLPLLRQGAFGDLPRPRKGQPPSKGFKEKIQGFLYGVTSKRMQGDVDERQMSHFRTVIEMKVVGPRATMTQDEIVAYLTSREFEGEVVKFIRSYGGAGQGRRKAVGDALKRMDPIKAQLAYSLWMKEIGFTGNEDASIRDAIEFVNQTGDDHVGVAEQVIKRVQAMKF